MVCSIKPRFYIVDKANLQRHCNLINCQCRRLVTLQGSTHNRLPYRSIPMHAIVVDIKCFT